jgi:hypothetical protein
MGEEERETEEKKKKMKKSGTSAIKDGQTLNQPG